MTTTDLLLTNIKNKLLGIPLIVAPYYIRTTTNELLEDILIAIGGGGGGTVTSVGLSLPVNDYNVSGSPVVGAGTLTGTWKDGSLHDALNIRSVFFYNRQL